MVEHRRVRRRRDFGVREDGRLDAVFHALADGTRRAILRDTAGRAKTVSEIAAPYRVTLAAVSKHIKVLEAAGLVRREKRGSFQYVQTNARPMRAAKKWLSYYEKYWTERLEALETLLDREDEKR
jgi:DNA-binding transcriptional ArsR family regulator